MLEAPVDDAPVAPALSIHAAPVLIAAVDHAVSGVLIVCRILTGEPARIVKTTRLYEIAEFCGGDRRIVAFVLIASAVAAIVALRRLGPRGLAWAMPQNLLMMLSAAGILSCVARGVYADGYPGGVTFILSDQWMALSVALWNPYAVWRLHSKGRLA